MHELSIADALVRTALAHARGRPLVRVGVRVGHLRQVVPSALEFAFRLLADGTPADGAELELETVPARLRCRDCGVESTAVQFPLCCDACGTLRVDVIAGEELRVEWIELEEPSATSPGAGEKGYDDG